MLFGEIFFEGGVHLFIIFGATTIPQALGISFALKNKVKNPALGK